MAEELYAGAISLPMFPAMDDSDVERVVAELRELLAELRGRVRDRRDGRWAAARPAT